MLPLVQTHPRVVPPSPDIESIATSTSINHHAFRPEHHQRRAMASPYQRSFPIRMSQSHQRAVLSPTTLFSPDHDHHLRRKTPNGTIDAGYDGSPTQLFPGPPPLKHVIVPTPTPANGSPYFSPPNPPSRPLLNAPGTEYLLSANASESREPGLTTSPWLFSLAKSNPEMMLAPEPPLPWPPTPYAMPGQYQGMHQPLVRAAEYNVRAFCPPPAPMSESSAFGQAGWQPEASLRSPRYFGAYSTSLMNRALSDPASCPSQRHLEAQQPYGCISDPGAVHDFRQSSYIDLQGLCLNPGASTEFSTSNEQQRIIVQPSFREKAISLAHRHYVDLLSYLQTTRNSKSNSGSEASSKLVVYPRPPKPRQPGLNVAQHGPGSFQGSIGSEIIVNHNHHGWPSMPSRDNPLSSRGDNQVGLRCRLAPRTQAVSANHAASYSSVSFTGSASTIGEAPPTANARASLGMLKSLCEQSNWEWVDGMLLGGCLQYGLEKYEDALEWFSRIVVLHSSHVEAITNMAATLYCLNRQDEAEQQWLRAVKMCPSYLEATEHLVGLLYKKRSQEAVEIICYVQEKLRVAPGPVQRTQPTSVGESASRAHPEGLADSRYLLANNGQISAAGALMHNGSEAFEFGSSGYALPGSENGRILALVHAKGTILYSLKDIQRASEAFEEAVLISVGGHIKSVQDLVHQIHAVLSPGERLPAPDGHRQICPTPLLLPPEKARQTAHLVFAGGGELPGLSLIPDGPAKRAAVQTTSNALLSLAKIFQDATSSGSADPSLSQRPSGVGDILALYYLSLSLQESPSTANNVGIMLAGVQAAPRTLDMPTAMPPQPKFPGIVPGSGLALALAYYNYGLRLDPKHVHLHTNLGSLLKDVGQLDLAIQMYERAVSCDGSFDIALTNLANAVKDRGRINDAITYYRRAVNSNPAFAEAVCGLFTALNSVCDWRGRGGVLLESGRYDRWHVDENGALVDARTAMLGSGLTKRVVDIVSQQLEEASQWGCNILQQSTTRASVLRLQNICHAPGFDLGEELRGWTRRPWEGSRLVRLVERATRVILRRWYHDRHVAGREAAASQYLRPRLPASLVVPPAPTVLPFHTFTCPLSARDIRLISQRNAMRISCSTLRSPWLPDTVYPPPPPPNPHLNIGYVSSDFNNHPLAHLMQSVFGFHNARRARAFCYATTPSDRSVHRQKIEREAPVFRDVSTWSPDKLIEQIVRDQIHILVNLNGYTRGARNEVFAARPAPIQMSFMGFAGTLGAEWCDYILADSTAIPPSTLRRWRSNVGVEDVFRDGSEGDEPHWMYSENIIFCRDTFFCCDHAQSCEGDERGMTWEDEERRRWRMRKELFPTIPDDVIILANFNQLYKIEPTTFRSWLRILARTPKAVLWLLRFPELGESNLRQTAEAWAGSEVASRLIFTDVAPKSQHISRARVCDLFLDTPECNAHTTAADVLWSSTPLLTLPRYPYKMCSRMAASILKGALPKSAEGRQMALELIMGSETGYEESAAELAGGLSYTVTETGYGEGRGRLAEMRKVLWENKWQCALFNTRRWVNDVEEAYGEAWRRWVAGEGGDILL